MPYSPHAGLNLAEDTSIIKRFDTTENLHLDKNLQSYIERLIPFIMDLHEASNGIGACWPPKILASLGLHLPGTLFTNRGLHDFQAVLAKFEPNCVLGE